MKYRKSRIRQYLEQAKESKAVKTAKANDSASVPRYFGNENEPIETQEMDSLENAQGVITYQDQVYDDRSIPNQNEVAGNTIARQQHTNPSGTDIPNYVSSATPVLPDNSNNDAVSYNIGNDVFPTLHHQVTSTDIAVNPDHFLPLTSQTVIASPNAALEAGEDVANPSVGLYPASSEKVVKSRKKRKTNKDFRRPATEANSDEVHGDGDKNYGIDAVNVSVTPESFNAATQINTTNPHSHIPNMVGQNIEHLIDEPVPPEYTNDNELRIPRDRNQLGAITNPLNLPRREAHERHIAYQDQVDADLDADKDITEKDITSKVMPDSSLPSTPESLYEARLYGNVALQSLKLYKGLRPEDVGIVSAQSIKETEVVEFMANPYPTPATTPIAEQNREPRQAFVAHGQDKIPPHTEVVNQESALSNSKPLTEGGDTIDYNVTDPSDDVILRQVIPPAEHYENDMYSAPADQNVKTAGIDPDEIARHNAMKAWMNYMNVPNISGINISGANTINSQPEGSGVSAEKLALKSIYRDFGTNPAPIPFEETTKNHAAIKARLKEEEMMRDLKMAREARERFKQDAAHRKNMNEMKNGVNNAMGNVNIFSRIKHYAVKSNEYDDNNQYIDQSVTEAISSDLTDEAKNAYYVKPTTPAGANTNVHAEPVAEFIAVFNEIAVDTMRDMQTAGIPKILDPRFEQHLPEYEIVTPERLERLIAVGEQALEEHKASLALPKPSDMDEEQYAIFIDSNNDVIEAIDQTLDYLFDALEIVDAAHQYDSYMLPVVGDVDDDPSIDGDVATIVTLNQRFYEALYYASLFMQRSGDRFDQFVVNMKRPESRFQDGLITSLDNDEDLEFDGDWNYKLGADSDNSINSENSDDDDDTDDDNSGFDVTDQLVQLAAEAIPLDKVSYPFAKAGSGNMYSFYKTAVKNSLSLRQTLAAFNKVYSRVMSAAGGWLYANPLVSGVSKAELDALAEEGLIRYDSTGSRFTLSRVGYERPQWLDLSAGVKPSPLMNGKY